MITGPDTGSAPKRVVSLVPSFTESYFDLGLGSYIVGVTDFCNRPEELLSSIPRVGGPKNPDIEQILALKPDLILASQEENPQEAIYRLNQQGIPVWLKTPKTTVQVMQFLWELVDLYGEDYAAKKMIALEQAFEWADLAAENLPAHRYFCPIWCDKNESGMDYWITYNGHTYPADLLRLFGGVNCFENRERRYPLEADLGLCDADINVNLDTRYPRLTKEEINAAQPEWIILPDEPFKFGEKEIQQLVENFKNTPAVRQGNVVSVDGSLLFWYGTRLARALNELPMIFDPMI